MFILKNIDVKYVKYIIKSLGKFSNKKLGENFRGLINGRENKQEGLHSGQYKLAELTIETYFYCLFSLYLYVSKNVFITYFAFHLFYGFYNPGKWRTHQNFASRTKATYNQEYTHSAERNYGVLLYFESNYKFSHVLSF